MTDITGKPTDRTVKAEVRRHAAHDTAGSGTKQDQGPRDRNPRRGGDKQNRNSAGPQPAPARLVALRALLDLEQNRELSARDCISDYVEKANLEAADARLATALVLGVIRFRSLLDMQFLPFLRKPVATLHRYEATLFRLVAAQKFLFDRIPPHAAVNDAVLLARQVLRIHPSRVGFLNAVCRSICARQDAALPQWSGAENAAAYLGTTPELFHLFEQKFGPREAHRLLAATRYETPLALRVNRLRSDLTNAMAALSNLGFEAQAGALSPDAILTNASAPAIVESFLFSEGLVYIQDESSQLVAHAAAPKHGQRILDLCSAPGGKATHMAELSGGEAQITATDISAERLKLVAENIERLQSPNVELAPWADIFESLPRAQWDTILIDAPCSSLGTLRSNPEIRMRLTRDEIAAHAKQQLELLVWAAPRVKSGGHIVYSTCSVADEENGHVVREFLQTHTNFAISDPQTPAATWPQHSSADGFEIRLLTRRNDA